MSKLAVGVFGAPGVGKSTLLQDHVAAHGDDRHIVGSSIIKQVLAPLSVRDMDAWPDDRQASARAEAIRRLEVERAATVGVLLVDGHFSLRSRTTGALSCVVTPEDRGFYGGLVLLDSSAHQVFEQMRADSRRRHGLSEALVAEHLERERTLAVEIAQQMEVPFTVITATSRADRRQLLGTFLDSIRGLV